MKNNRNLILPFSIVIIVVSIIALADIHEKIIGELNVEIIQLKDRLKYECN